MTNETVEILNDIKKWVRIIGIQQAKDLLDSAMSVNDSTSEEEHKIIYHLTDGNHGTRDIANHVPVGKDTVSNIQRMWSDMGLVEKDKQNQPYSKLIGLNEAGMEIPDIPETEKDDNE